MDAMQVKGLEQELDVTEDLMHKAKIVLNSKKSFEMGKKKIDERIKTDH
jgi:hypothetical protein